MTNTSVSAKPLTLPHSGLMALALLPSFPSSSSSLTFNHKPQPPPSPKRFILHFKHPNFPCLFSATTILEPSSSSTWKPSLLVAAAIPEAVNGEKSLTTQNDDVFKNEEEQQPPQRRPRGPCEIYVCNLPRSCNAAHLLDLFKPYGTIISVEVSRNAETGESRGCGYVVMGSINSAKSAIAALDGSDVGGRELRVRFSAEMSLERTNAEEMYATPKRTFYYEAPHKLYVGNLARAVKPEELRNHFIRFGNVLSVRVLHDRKQGKARVYAFLSFQSEAERDAAMSLNGTEFYGRNIVVREGGQRTEP